MWNEKHKIKRETQQHCSKCYFEPDAIFDLLFVSRFISLFVSFFEVENSK